MKNEFEPGRIMISEDERRELAEIENKYLNEI